MKNKLSLLSILALALVLGALAACTPSGSAPTEGVAPTDQAPAATEGAAEIATLFVGPELVECTGVAPQTCMQVRRSADEDYTLFYGQIDGFTFEPGFDYELKVEISQVANPPADGSSLSYKLIEVVSKTPAATAEASALEGVRWGLVSYTDAGGNTATAVPGVDAAITFADGTVGGTAGCNNFSGSYTVDGNSLTVGPLISTMMACPGDGVMQQEAAVTANLQAAATYAINGDTLTIADASGATTLTFVATEPASLAGTSWVVTGYNNGNEAVVSTILGTTITANFMEDGSLNGNAGCNQYTSSYTVNGDAITIQPGASTMMMCAEPEGIMEQEAQYLAALATAATYQIDGTTLTLRTADGAMAATFTAVEPTGLAGTSWDVTGYNNGNQAVVSVINGTAMTANFMEDGSLSGNAGCNQYNSSYTVDGDAITIQPPASTRMLCSEPEGIMDQEAQYLAALATAATFETDGTTLTLRTADGAMAATFAAAVPTAASQLPEELVVVLGNATYPLTYDAAHPESITLVDGAFHAPVAAGSASEIATTLVGPSAVGQLEDGQNVAAVVLATSTGGSGTFYDLAVATIENGSVTNVATTYLGDRVTVNSVEIANGMVVVDMLTQGPDEAACCGTTPVVMSYQLTGGALVPVEG